MVAVVTLVLIIVAVAFFTLLERKVLGYIHLRKGPNKPGPGGVIVPFADAVKLFLKELSCPTLSNKAMFNLIAPSYYGGSYGAVICVSPLRPGAGPQSHMCLRDCHRQGRGLWHD